MQVSLLARKPQGAHTPPTPPRRTHLSARNTVPLIESTANPASVLNRANVPVASVMPAAPTAPANVATVHGADGVGVALGVPVGVPVAVPVAVPLLEGVGLDDSDAPVLGVALGVGEKERDGQRSARTVPEDESPT